MNSDQAWEIYAHALEFATSLVIVPITEVEEAPERPKDIISIRVCGARPRLEAQPIAPDMIKMLDSGLTEQFAPERYRMVASGSQIALKIVDKHGDEVHGLLLDSSLVGLTAQITYRCSEDLGERLALTIHEGMEPDPIERIEFGPRTSFKETFEIPLRGAV